MGNQLSLDKAIDFWYEYKYRIPEYLKQKIIFPFNILHELDSNIKGENIAKIRIY